MPNQQPKSVPILTAQLEWEQTVYHAFSSSPRSVTTRNLELSFPRTDQSRNEIKKSLESTATVSVWRWKSAKGELADTVPELSDLVRGSHRREPSVRDGIVTEEDGDVLDRIAADYQALSPEDRDKLRAVFRGQEQERKRRSEYQFAPETLNELANLIHPDKDGKTMLSQIQKVRNGADDRTLGMALVDQGRGPDMRKVDNQLRYGDLDRLLQKHKLLSRSPGKRLSRESCQNFLNLLPENEVMSRIDLREFGRVQREQAPIAIKDGNDLYYAEEWTLDNRPPRERTQAQERPKERKETREPGRHEVQFQTAIRNGAARHDQKKTQAPDSGRTGPEPKR